MGVFLRAFSKVSGLIIDILWWYRPFLYGGVCPIYFFRELGSSGSLFVFKFHIFDKPILEEYVSQVEGGSHLLQSCLCVTQNDLLLLTKEMHPSFESLVITGTLGLQASLMEIHHNTSVRFILEDNSIPSTSRAHIHSCSGKEVGLWLVVRPSIRSFRIAHFTFTSTLRFCFGLI